MDGLEAGGHAEDEDHVVGERLHREGRHEDLGGECLTVSPCLNQLRVRISIALGAHNVYVRYTKENDIFGGDLFWKERFIPSHSAII